MGKNTKVKKSIKFLAFMPLAIAAFFCIFLSTRHYLINSAIATPLTEKEQKELKAVLDQNFPQRTKTVKSLPYTAPLPDFDTYAKAAILINAHTGEILFEKNADMEIPPASMTKLFLIYSVLQKARRGEVNLDDIIPIDERAIAANMPPRSSLMFLGLGQIVTLRELLQGTSVSSGNDAAHQIAFSLYGSMENFINEINATIKSLGLKKTHIVESSGYSEENITTPREMAMFCKIYLEEFPEALNDFHSIKEFAYPKRKNLPPEQQDRMPQKFEKDIPKEFWTTIIQENTNKLLGALEGCDGIKTGHIDESGYNLSLTTMRNGVRYISVTMLGPGNGIKEGDRMRCTDGAALQNWAHACFEEYKIPDDLEFNLPVYGSKEKAVRVVPAYTDAIAVPKSSAPVEINVELPEYLFGEVRQGAPYGKIVFSRDKNIIAEIPMVAEKDGAPANEFLRRCDSLMLRIY